MSKTSPINYPTEPSRLSFYPGSCLTPIGSELWKKHTATLRILERQARALGLWEIAYEFSKLIETRSQPSLELS